MLVRMKRFKLACICACLCVSMQSFAQSDSLIIRKMFNQIVSNGLCYSRLDYLSNQIGGRLSGSPEAARAVQYTFDQLKSEGFDSVWLQEVMVPHWVRGEKEKAYIVSNGKKQEVAICALGNSIGTGKSGIKGKVIEVKSFDELKKLGKEKVEGKIVFYNRPMNPLFIRTFEAYGDAVDQRAAGAIEAAKYGAIAVVVRSMASNVDPYPHTGAMRYQEGVKQIPACAISTLHAEQLSKQLVQNNELEFFFKQTCEMLPEVLSYNVIAQINGTERPEEIIVVGGHLDAWDNGDGAHDDGSGVVQSMEVLHTFKTLGLKPRRTIRCVLFMNEENGLRGGVTYAKVAKEKGEKHLAAIETDAGGFTPRSFSASASSEILVKMKQWEPLLKQYGIEEIASGGGGADIGPLKPQGTVLIGYGPDSQRYFDLHHSGEDTFDKVSKRELEFGAATISGLIWLISEYGL